MECTITVKVSSEKNLCLVDVSGQCLQVTPPLQILIHRGLKISQKRGKSLHKRPSLN